MDFAILPVMERGRRFAFPAAWAAVFATGIGLSEPLPSFDIAPYLSFAPIGAANARTLDPQSASLPVMDSEPEALIFVRREVDELSRQVAEAADTFHYPAERPTMGHGRFAAPGNAVRRKVQMQPINPRTADELAGFFRDVAYTLNEIRLGEAVPPLKVERVPDDLGKKDGNERKTLFITAILPVVLEVNQRVLADREHLLQIREKLAFEEGLSPLERIWLDDLADRYDGSVDDIDELVKRVDIVPPSMAIAQGGVESGWGTSFAARTANALYGQIQAVGRHSVAAPWKPGRGMPQPFSSVGDATEAYIANLNTHPAYAGFRTARARMRQQGESLEGYQLIGTLLRYSERGLQYVQFVRQIMRENELGDFDRARLPEH